MIVVDGHGGRVSITTHRNRPKSPKNNNLKKIGKKVLRWGWVVSSETQVIFFLPYPIRLLSIELSILYF